MTLTVEREAVLLLSVSGDFGIQRRCPSCDEQALEVVGEQPSAGDALPEVPHGPYQQTKVVVCMGCGYRASENHFVKEHIRFVVER